MVYEINHIWTVETKWKWRNDRRSERNLCNCVKKPEKNSGLHWPFWGYTWNLPGDSLNCTKELCLVGEFNNWELLSKAVFEQRTSNESGLFAFLGSGFTKILGQIVSIRVKTLSNTNLLALTLLALRVISIKFLLVISMLCKTEWSWELLIWSHKKHLLDILSTSPHRFYRKWAGVTNENSNFNS